MQRIRQYRLSNGISSGAHQVPPPRLAFAVPSIPRVAADIPSDCMRLSMSFLTPQELAVAYKVCMRWAAIAIGDDLWLAHLSTVFGDRRLSGGTAMDEFRTRCAQRQQGTWATSRFASVTGAGCCLVRSSMRTVVFFPPVLPPPEAAGA
eukprot:TRINITY_DN9715_c0_g1_i1.p2 TRINITY_DN9715_c0_g1~~TRINITY_DN9715_c0_g1_i1.p2  ORF type:complete len:149 (-),score=5.79 TRINITY_DN9715_c0_g1_i1:116-562(-)